MTATITNSTPYNLKFLGFDTLSIDGWTQTDSYSMPIRQNQSGTLKVTKGGGTDGLFTGGGFEIGIPGLSAFSFFVFFSMSAAAGGSVRVPMIKIEGWQGVGGAASAMDTGGKNAPTKYWNGETMYMMTSIPGNRGTAQISVSYVFSYWLLVEADACM